MYKLKISAPKYITYTYTHIYMWLKFHVQKSISKDCTYQISFDLDFNYCLHCAEKQRLVIDGLK